MQQNKHPSSFNKHPVREERGDNLQMNRDFKDLGRNHNMLPLIGS